MPYIKPKDRNNIDFELTKLILEIEAFEEDERHGVLNYCITTMVARTLRPKGGWRYHALQKAYGLFGCAAAEFYRRLIAPYEDKAIQDNGDISEYPAQCEDR